MKFSQSDFFRFVLPKFFVIGFAVTLQGCAVSSDVMSQFDPSTQARIRIFHGTSAYIYLGDVCDNDSHQVIHAANGGFSYLVPNKRIGMPVTDDMPFSYNEYAVPANRPLTVKMYWQAQNAGRVWEHCGPFYTTFTPSPGQNYDAAMEFRYGVCQGMRVREIVPLDDEKTIARPALLNKLPFRSCR